MWKPKKTMSNNPPPEPEIHITEEMIRAGQKARGHWFAPSVCDIYRAMRTLEPKFGGSIKSSPKVVVERRLCVERRKKLLMCLGTPTDPMGRRSGKDRRKL
jgi:hypothetical protein